MPSKAQVKSAATQGAAKYKGLDSASKTAVNAGSVMAVLLVCYTGYKAVSGVGDVLKTVTGQKWTEERKESERKERSLLTNVLYNTREKPTLTKIEAKNIADSLFQAFLNTQPEWSRNLWDEGTDEDGVWDNLALLKNRSDWLLVSIQYGMPRDRNLASELSYELNPDEKKKARGILSKINVKI